MSSAHRGRRAGRCRSALRAPGLSPAVSPQVTSMCLGPSWWTWSRAPWTLSGLDPSARSSGLTTSCLVRRGDAWALAQWVPFLLTPWGSLLSAWGRLCVHRGPGPGLTVPGPWAVSPLAPVHTTQRPGSACRGCRSPPTAEQPGAGGQRTKSEGKLPAAVHRPLVISEDP